MVHLVQLYGKLQPRNAEPLGIELLAAVVKNEHPECNVRVSSLMASDDDSRLPSLIDNLDDSRVGVIGIAIPQGTYQLALKLLDSLRARGSSALVVLGHALPTYMPEVFLDRYPEAIIVAGWAEDAFNKLISEVRLGSQHFDSVPNLVFRKGGQVVSTSTSPDVRMPKPVRLQPDRIFARVEASRGCHYDACTFCTRPPRAFNASRWCRRSPEDVIADVAELKRAGVTTFTFTDEDFVGSDLEGALAIAKRLQRIGGMHFSFSCRVSNVWAETDTPRERSLRRDVFAALREAGLSLLFLGVESFSDSQLHRYGKGTTAADNLQAIDVIQGLGVTMELGFILFDPFLSIDELRENIAALERTGHWQYVGNLLDRLRIQRGAPFEKLARSRGALTIFDAETMETAYAFEDPWVGDLANTCTGWHGMFADAYDAARNYVRSSVGTSELQFVRRYRQLAFRLLSEATRTYPRVDELSVIRTLFEDRARTILRQLQEEMLATQSNEGLFALLEDCLGSVRKVY